MIVGFLDDRSDGGWSEYRLGAIDLVIAVIASMVICEVGAIYPLVTAV